MLAENENLKNSIVKDIGSVPAQYEAEGFRSASYSKTNKLVTALYMVTDIMEKEEPLRNKLRTLGVNIISDTHSLMKDSLTKNISETISLLDIASAVGIISVMNCNILKKEFTQLDQSVQDSKQKLMLSDFFSEPEEDVPEISRPEFKGHQKHNIGLQKGSTLMKALQEIKLSNKESTVSVVPEAGVFRLGFDLLKKQRREVILKIIKDKPEGVSIKDIALSLKNLGKEWGEKTLQRELVSMVNDSVLKKTGEKRWSKYFLD